MPSPSDRDLLTLAGEFRKYPGTREREMRERFDMSSVEFWRRVLVIVAAPSPELAAEFPGTIRVLRARRDEGLRRRNGAHR